jgi:hypothetical protein
MTSRRALAFLLGVAACFATGTAVLAAQYPGWGDTGWDYGSRRECCDAAIALANQDSANRCIESGGIPRATTGVRRGSCTTDWTYDDEGGQLLRCYSETAVWCR